MPERSRVEVEVLRTEFSTDHDGTRVALDLRIPDAGAVTLKADVGVRIDTGRESSAPEGTVPPRVGTLTAADGLVLEPDPHGRFRLPGGGEWTLLVHSRDFAALDLQIDAHIEAADGGA